MQPNSITKSSGLCLLHTQFRIIIYIGAENVLLNVIHIQFVIGEEKKWK